MPLIPKLLNNLLGKTEAPDFPLDFDPEVVALCQEVQPFTMTSPERIFALRQSVEYVIKHRIEGDIVECGVWKGGSMMVVAKTLQAHDTTRALHLFDTFEGMSEPTDHDRSIRGRSAAEQLDASPKASTVWAYADLDEVKQNLTGTGYEPRLMHFVKGKVEDTIPAHAPERIALLRLDTDWYESTYHELVHLYPRLSVGGVLIIDDYGHWQGARKAVDQYIEEKGLKLLLQRVDYTSRICVKLEA